LVNGQKIEWERKAMLGGNGKKIGKKGWRWKNLSCGELGIF